MRLCRIGEKGRERPGLLLADGSVIDASDFGEDYDERFFCTNGIERLKAWLEERRELLPKIPSSTRLGPAVCRPSKIVCIGVNYRDHAAETGARILTEPVIFMKATSAYSGPFDEVKIPRNSEQTDYEVEIAVVIGKRASYVEEGRAEECVAGYVLFNDYSERSFQKYRGGQWVKGKSADTFAPIGPYLVTPDEIADVHNLDMWLKVNDEYRQNSNTGNMIFKIPFLVSYVSQFMTLLPGDLLSTGTPSGVALGMKEPKYLKPGDVVEYGITGLGEARQVVGSYVLESKSLNHREP